MFLKSFETRPPHDFRESNFLLTFMFKYWQILITNYQINGVFALSQATASSSRVSFVWKCVSLLMLSIKIC